MPKILLWRKPDGGLAFTVTTTDDTAEAEAHAKALTEIPSNAVHHPGFQLIGICDDTDMPDGGCTTKTRPAAIPYKGAWDVDANGRPTVNMDRAREVHRGFLRQARVSKFAELDVEYQRADEGGNQAEKAVIAAKKQQLRDVTADPSIDAARTPEELVNIWPEMLDAK